MGSPTLHQKRALQNSNSPDLDMSPTESRPASESRHTVMMSRWRQELAMFPDLALGNISSLTGKAVDMCFSTFFPKSVLSKLRSTAADSSSDADLNSHDNMPDYFFVGMSTFTLCANALPYINGHYTLENTAGGAIPIIAFVFSLCTLALMALYKREFINGRTASGWLLAVIFFCHNWAATLTGGTNSPYSIATPPALIMQFSNLFGNRRMPELLCACHFLFLLLLAYFERTDSLPPSPLSSDTEFWLRWTSSLSNVPVLILGLYIEESQRKAREARLRALAEEATKASKAKSVFLAVMSHEMRTPLNHVMIMTDLLEHELDSPAESDADSYEEVPNWDTRASKCAELVSTLRGSAKMLLDVINDVLDLSKIEAGKLELDARPNDLLKLVKRTMATFSPSAIAKGLVLETEMPDQTPLLMFDRLKVRQILTNLVGNAVKFTETGSIRVRVSNNGVNIGFEVADTGVGIAEEELQRLFQPFSQAESTRTTRKYGGSGLGLVIARQLARLMGGDLTVCSKKGEGSTFTFQMPLILAPEGSAPDPLTQAEVDENDDEKQVEKVNASGIEVRLRRIFEETMKLREMSQTGGSAGPYASTKSAHADSRRLRVSESDGVEARRISSCPPPGVLDFEQVVNQRCLVPRTSAGLQIGDLFRQGSQFGFGFGNSGSKNDGLEMAGLVHEIEEGNMVARRCLSARGPSELMRIQLDLARHLGVKSGTETEQTASTPPNAKGSPTIFELESEERTAMDTGTTASRVRTGLIAKSTASKWGPRDEDKTRIQLRDVSFPAPLIPKAVETESGGEGASTRETTEIKTSNPGVSIARAVENEPAGQASTRETFKTKRSKPRASISEVLELGNGTPNRVKSQRRSETVLPSNLSPFRSKLSCEGILEAPTSRPSPAQRCAYAAERSPPEAVARSPQRSQEAVGDLTTGEEERASGGTALGGLETLPVEPRADTRAEARKSRMRGNRSEPVRGRERSASGVSSTALDGYHLLVVDDNELNAKLTARLLQCLGAKVTTLYDGVSAVSTVRDSPEGAFDAMLLDICMPEVDGFEVAKRIRATEASRRWKPLPVVALTAMSLTDDRDRALASGMHDFVTKPFTKSGLLEKILSAMGAAREAGSRPPPSST